MSVKDTGAYHRVVTEFLIAMAIQGAHLLLTNQEFMQMQHQAQHMKKLRRNMPHTALEQAQQQILSVPAVFFT